MQMEQGAGEAVARLDGVDAARLRQRLEGAVENLVATWSEERGLFPFSSRLTPDGIRNDYDHPIAVRYTINSLLGLARAESAGLLDDALVNRITARFLDVHSDRVTSMADVGLMLHLQAERGAEEEIRTWSNTLETLLSRTPLGRLTLQDVAWATWGAAEAGAEATALRGLRTLRGEMVERTSMLPRHSVRRYRRRLVSFGGLVYYLRALDTTARLLEDDWAETAFESGVKRALALQGPLGEWPWLLDIRGAEPVDVYPVFAVHQDSMAMLFLLPALDRRMAGASEAIRTSLAWCDGVNELGVPMYVDAPVFFAYRAIERPERAPRLRRYLRSFTAGRGDFGSGAVRLNDECRSYHLGWLLYAWCTRPEITRL